MARRTYRINCTPAKYSVTHTDLYSVMVKMPPDPRFEAMMKKLGARKVENWERAIDQYFDTEEEAKKALEDLRRRRK